MQAKAQMSPAGKAMAYVKLTETDDHGKWYKGKLPPQIR